MNIKLLLTLSFLSVFYCFPQTDNNQKNKNIDQHYKKAPLTKKLYKKKFVDEACAKIEILQLRFQNIMSKKYRRNSAKLDKAIEEIIKMFDEGAEIEIINSKDEKRPSSVRDYFTLVRDDYLRRYNIFSIVFDIECDESNFKETENGIEGAIKFEQTFTGKNNKVVYFDITIKKILIRSNTESYSDGTKDYYDVKFKGIKAEKIVESDFMEPIPDRKL